MSSTSNRFGIIRSLPSGIPQWVEAVEGLAEAKAYLMRLAVREPGEFYIYSETSGVIVERFVCVGIDGNTEGAEESTEIIEISSPGARFLN